MPKKYCEYKINTISQIEKKEKNKIQTHITPKTHTIIEFKENKQGKSI